MFLSAKTVPSFNYLFFQEDKDRQKDGVAVLSFVISTQGKIFMMNTIIMNQLQNLHR